MLRAELVGEAERNPMSITTLDWQIDPRVLTLRLKRREQPNAFAVAMANAREAACRRASEDDAMGAIVATGAGHGASDMPSFYPWW
jgi:enoyl-CoA hydratase/carnithine racemase